jgi:hypothetical protein
VNHFTTTQFWKCFYQLPEEIQHLARKQYQHLIENPKHPSLSFKKLYDQLWSVRVNQDYRALAVETTTGYIWFWIGNHAEYELIIKR